MNSNTTLTNEVSKAKDAAPAGWYALAVLVLVTLFSFVDRQIFVVLAEPIRQQLGLSDLQLGLLQGVGIAMFAAIAGYPLGWLADRYDRRIVLAGCVIVWSVAVVACGMAQNFEQLFIASAMVGAGEAGLVPVVYALIPELFRNQRRLLANSIYAMATRLGVGLAIALCGQLVLWADASRVWLPASLQGLESWRLAFFAAALPAPLMVLLIVTLSIRNNGNSVRRVAASADFPPNSATTQSVRAYLADHRRAFVGFFSGIGMAVFGFSSVITWVPTITIRMFGETPTHAASATGIATLIASIVGFAFSLYGIRVLTPRLGMKLPMVILWTATASAAVTSFMLLFATSAMQIYVMQGVQMAFVMSGILLYPSALQSLCPSHLRSRIVAINGVVSIVFAAASPLVVGALSDALKSMPNGLLVAAVSVATLSLGLSATLLWWATGAYEAAVTAAESSDEATIAT